VTPLYPQKLALTSPTGGGRSVGMVRSLTKATEFVCLFVLVTYYIKMPYKIPSFSAVWEKIVTGKASRRLNHESVILIQEYSEELIGGTELKLLLLEAFLYVPAINMGFCLYSVRLIYY
jgi:hypothetical protein